MVGGLEEVLTDGRGVVQRMGRDVALHNDHFNHLIIMLYVN